MRESVEAPAVGPAVPNQERAGEMASAPVLPVLIALSFGHLINDTLQSLIPAIYPIIKQSLRLDFQHIGLITLTNQLTASLLQPFVGWYNHGQPQPFAL